MAIGSGVVPPGVAENPTFPILRALAYTTGLGDGPTCDKISCSFFLHYYSSDFSNV